VAWIAPEIDRIETLSVADERPMLQSWLDYHRQTLLFKCAGLNAAQLAQRCVAPSKMSLHGLIRHLTENERGWFRVTAAGESLDYLYCSEANPDGDFDDVPDADPATDLATYHRERTLADAAVAPLRLDHRCHHPVTGTEYTLRWIYLHMIEEYARHNGHADFLRERIDGRTGQ
jgi:hypothetical protein